MTRKEFVKICGLLGIGFPLGTGFTSCNKSNEKEDLTQKVIIIGAGAAGLMAGYLLHQKGVDFQILEASSVYGGRMKRTTDFADFPIPLGAEWLHVERGILNEAVNDSSIQVNIETKPYDHNVDYALFEGNQVSVKDVGFTIDQKFVNATWFDFFEQYIAPEIKDKITFNQVITSINYTESKVVVNTNNNQFSADKVIITAPVKILQNGAITFVPELPKDKQEAIDGVTVWDGYKAFIEFSEKFYPAFTAFNIVPESAGQKLYYDASYGQNSSRHVLGLFAVGSGTLPYATLEGQALIDFMLKELDDLYDGKASKNYIKHTFQNWKEEPFINGAYINDSADWRKVRTLGQSVNGKLFFAGTSYTTGDDWGSVHTAIRSAKRAVQELL